MKKYLSLVAMAVSLGSAIHDSARAQGVVVIPQPPRPIFVTNTILPEVTGTIAFWPELGLWGMPVGNDVQSYYFRTTAVNREFRRGFLEFSIPEFSNTVASATLLLTESRGQTTFPLPPDKHEISYYEADLAVTTNDYHAATSPLAEFETDNNVAPESFSFDLTTLVNAYKGRKLGLRIQLAVDPDYFGEGFLGTGFQNNSQSSPARIILVRTDVSPVTPIISLKTARTVALEPNGWHRTQDGLFVIRRTGNTSAAMQVACAIGGTAQNGKDCESIASVIRIPAGAASATVAVRPLADRVRERPETVTLHLLPSPEASYELAPRAEGRVIIIDRSRVTR
jgi:hypothetical protein